MANELRQHLLTDWPGPWRKWAINYCLRNQWRVACTLGNLDDCIAECSLIYCECCRRYGGTVASDASFMALYKLVTTSWFTTLSWKDTRTREYLETLWDGDVEIESDANLTVKLREASKEVKEVLKVMFFAPEEVMGVFRREVKSHNPRSFLNHVFSYCEISEHDWTRLSKEIYELVS